MKIFIDKNLRKVAIPSDVSKASDFDKAIYPAGSRIKLPDIEGNNLRIYTAWYKYSKSQIEKFDEDKKNELNRTDRDHIDVDLSAILITKGDDNEPICDFVSYWSNSNERVRSSGDARSCIRYDEENGVMTAEFIDVDMAECVYDYIIISNNVYNRLPFGDFNCYTGIQIIPNVYKDEKNGKKVINLNSYLSKMRLVGDEEAHLSYIYDVAKNEIIVVDKPTKNLLNVDGNAPQLINMLEFYENYFDKNSSIYELITLWAKSNNHDVVSDELKADIVISDRFKEVTDNQTLINALDKENIIKIQSLLES